MNRHDEAAFMALQDTSINGYTTVGQRDPAKFRQNETRRGQVSFFAVSTDVAKEMGFGDLAYLSAQPSAVFGVVANRIGE